MKLLAFKHVSDKARVDISSKVIATSNVEAPHDVTTHIGAMRDERTIGSIDLKTVKEKEAREGELHQHRRHYDAMNHVHGAKLHCAIMPEEYVGLRVAIRSLAVCHPTVLDQP